MNHDESRRAFLRASIAVAGASLVPRAALRALTRDASRVPLTLRVGLVAAGSPDARSPLRELVRGVTLGVEEANRSAALFAGVVALSREDPAPNVSDAAERLMTSARVTALVGGIGRHDCESIANVAERHGVLYFDLACTDDELRSVTCGRQAFHIPASESMRRVALDWWRRPAQASPGAPRNGQIAAWDRALEKYGAEQLNARYRGRFGAEMDDTAWAAWVGVKILWEAAVRARTTDPAVLARQLVRSESRFDGHKGAPLAFRARDHQLVQPLYVVLPDRSRGDPSPSNVLAEVPSRVTERVMMDESGCP
jgi:ABC-type branched-subunit amino acid transport system substrate-binding protein